MPAGTLLTTTPSEGRALAMTIARHTIHNIQHDLDILAGGRPDYSTMPDGLTADSHLVALAFAIATAHLYRRR